MGNSSSFTSPIAALLQGCASGVPPQCQIPWGAPAAFQLLQCPLQLQAWGCISLFLAGRLRDATAPGPALRMLSGSLWPTSGLPATGWGKACSHSEDFCLITTILLLPQLNYLHLCRVSIFPSTRGAVSQAVFQA